MHPYNKAQQEKKNQNCGSLPVFPQLCQSPKTSVHSLPLEVVQAPTTHRSLCRPMLLLHCVNKGHYYCMTKQESKTEAMCCIYWMLWETKRGVVTPAVPFTVLPSPSRIRRGNSWPSRRLWLLCFSLRDSNICSLSDKAGNTCRRTKDMP